MKSSFTLKPYLLKRRKKADGSFPVYIRITKAGKYSLQSTGISIDERQWNPERGEIRRSHPSYKALNSRINTELMNLHELIDSLPDDASLDDIRQSIQSSTTESEFFTYAALFIEGLKADGRFWVYKQSKNALNRWIDCFGNNLKVTEITYQTIDTYQRFLIKRGYHNNTIRKHIQNIRRIIDEALKSGLIEADPFRHFKPVKEKKTSKTRLSLDQIQAIEALSLQPGSWQAITRDAFMFSFYNAGIRFGDIARLQWKHIVDGRLKYNMAKTGTGKNIKLLNPALCILDKYKPEQPDPEAFIFPILKTNRDYSDVNYLKAQISSKNVIANKNLKRLAGMAGIEDKISFHVSRHSFADYARTGKMNIYDISKALGHSDITITQAYLKSFDETSLDSSMEQLFS